MIPRRNFLSLLGTGIATGWIVSSRNQSVYASVTPAAHRTDSCQVPGQEKFADPPWKKLSSASGDLPVPQTSDQQTGCVVGDIDGDGRPDFAITNRHQGKAAIWMQNTAQGWKQHIIDPG